MSLARKLRFAANPAEATLVARAAGLLAAVPSLLKFVEIEKIVRALTPARPRAGGGALPRDRVTYLCHRTFGLAARLRYRPNCLRRALVQYHCLRLHGVPALIHFGVKREDETLAGHCWLTVDGSLYDERADMVSQFAQMFSLPLGEDAPTEPGSSGGESRKPDPAGAGPRGQDHGAASPRDIKRLSFGG